MNVKGVLKKWSLTVVTDDVARKDLANVKDEKYSLSDGGVERAIAIEFDEDCVDLEDDGYAGDGSAYEVTIVAPTPEVCTKEMKKLMEEKKFIGKIIDVTDWGIQGLVMENGLFCEEDIQCDYKVKPRFTSVDTSKNARVSKLKPLHVPDTFEGFDISGRVLSSKGDQHMNFTLSMTKKEIDSTKYEIEDSWFKPDVLRILEKDDPSALSEDARDKWEEFRAIFAGVVWELLVRMFRGTDDEDIFCIDEEA